LNGADKDARKPEEKPKKAAPPKKAPAAEKKATEKKEKAPKKRAQKKVSSFFFRIYSLCLTYFTGCRRVWRRFR
jgi:hypothetical protein